MKQDGIDPPKGERPKFYSWSYICIKQRKFAKVTEGVAKPTVRPRKFATQINTRDLINKNWRVVQWFKSLGETPMTDFSHLALQV